MSNPKIRPPTLSPTPHCESSASFLCWTLRLLGIEADSIDGRLVVRLPESQRARFEGQDTLHIDLAARDDAEAVPGSTPLCWHGAIGQWLGERLAQAGPALHARPAQSPLSVSEVAQNLFAAYQVDGGQVHLAGCQLTDHPFLRLSFASDAESLVRHVFVAPDGSCVAEDLAPRLGLDNLAPIEHRPPRIDPAALRSLIDAGRRLANKLSERQPATAPPGEPIAVTLAWVRHAEGRVQMSVGSSSCMAPFAGWASLLEAQPYVGPDSGVASFHLAATDDGRIEAAEEIEACQQSGRRVLREELVVCSVTGKRVLPELTEVCPVAGLPALKGEFTVCPHCWQRVSRAVVSNEMCRACHSLTKVAKDDPRLIWIQGEHGGLGRWTHWRLAETDTCYLAEATGMLKRLWLVVDKQTLEIKRLATRGRLSGAWLDVPGEQRGDLLV